MIDQPQPPVPSESDYGARPTVPDLNPEDWDQYDGEVREPEPKPNGGSEGLGEWDAGDDDAPIEPRGWLLGNVYCRRFVSSLLAEGGAGKTAVRTAQALALAPRPASALPGLLVPFRVWCGTSIAMSCLVAMSASTPTTASMAALLFSSTAWLFTKGSSIAISMARRVMQFSMVSASFERTGCPVSSAIMILPAAASGVARNSHPLTSSCEMPWCSRAARTRRRNSSMSSSSETIKTRQR